MGDSGEVPYNGLGPLLIFHHLQRLSGHPGEGLNFSFQSEGLSRASAVLEGVPVAPRSAATGAVHPADLRPPNGWCLAP